jgi:hypothetical protein
MGKKTKIPTDLLKALNYSNIFGSDGVEKQNSGQRAGLRWLCPLVLLLPLTLKDALV